VAGSEVWARFDDLRAGTAVRCPPPYRVLAADTADVVPAVLAEVDRATAAGCWAYGYVGYEAAAGLDSTLPVHPIDPDGPPPAWFALCAPPVAVAPVPAAASAPLDWRPDWSDLEHHRAVDRVRAAIAAGDTYQVNLTDRLRGSVRGDPFALYAHLARAQAGAHNAYLQLGSHSILSASPELFLDWDGDLLRTRPMKGTAARGRTPEDDVRHGEQLRSSPKERAENLMIVDLLRNDLSRVARVGTVDVPELFVLERYPTVWQLTSEITARTADGVDLVEMFRALFPCGSVTGAPKVASMQIIRDLESGPRGVYCGAIGLVGPPGAPFRARFSVAIRTAVVDRATGAAVYGAGGAITWGSDAAAERAELLAKAEILRGAAIPSER